MPYLEWIPFWRILEIGSHQTGMLVFHHVVGWCRFVRVIPNTLDIEVRELDSMMVHRKPHHQIFVRVENYESKMHG